MEQGEKYFVAKICSDLLDNESGKVKKVREEKLVLAYSPGVYKRQNGVNSMVDTLGILNNIRLFKDIKDGGSHLSYEMMNHLNGFRNKNYYDETTGNCHKAMDKVIELYKEHDSYPPHSYRIRSGLRRLDEV